MNGPTAAWALGKLREAWPEGKYPGLTFTAYPEIAAWLNGQPIARGEQWEAVDAQLRSHDWAGAGSASPAPALSGEVPWAMLLMGFPEQVFACSARDQYGAMIHADSPAQLWEKLTARVGTATRNAWPERKPGSDWD